MVIVGVDVGVSGAVAIWDGKEMVVHSLPIRPDRTLDAVALLTLLLPLEPVLLITEGTFKPIPTIRFTGEVCAVGKIVGAEVEIVPVATWQKVTRGRIGKDKELSIRVCQELYPEVDLLPTPRSKKPSHDRAESVLQCHYGRLKWEAKV
jgi:hypothetical protein